MGLTTKANLTEYEKITAEIEKIQAEKRIDRKYATIFYFIKRLPKGEQSISVLSKSLENEWSLVNDEIKRPLNNFVNEIKNQ